MDKFANMGKSELRQTCREAGISYSKLDNDGMRDALRAQGGAAPAVQPVQEQPIAQPPAAPTKAPRAAKAAPAPKAPREERNGVKRPREGGVCAAVWSWLDQHGNMKPADLKPVAEANGWNFNNLSIELYAWRKFNGIVRMSDSK